MSADKNSEISIKAGAYLNRWKAIYTTELHEYAIYGLSFQNKGYFKDVTVYDQYGIETKIGFWIAQDTTYVPTIDGISENLTIQFTDANNRFYYDKTVTVNGVTRVKRYVFKRQ